jgi:hypothetical protein
LLLKKHGFKSKPYISVRMRPLVQQPVCGARIAAADIANGTTLQQGEAVTVQLNGTGLVALRGLSQVAYFIQPSPQLVAAVQDSYGVARGTVEQINNIAGVVEISIC